MTTPPYERLSGPPHPVVRAHGAILPELFEHAGVAIFSFTWPVREIPPRHSRPLVAPGDTPDELLVGWLDELMALSNAERLAVSYVTVDRLEEGGVQGSAAGMPFGDLAPLGPPVEGLMGSPSIVSIPDGFWVDLSLRLGPALRLV